MDTIAAILIGIGVLIGGIMAFYGFQNKHIPKGLAIWHGIFVALGIILLVIYALTTDSHHKHWDNIIVFLIAAAGGIYLLIRDLKKRFFKMWILVMHASIGLFGIIYLIIHLLE
jgi:peptidoglycan/LPS O-acetylase OafA/YrhL